MSEVATKLKVSQSSVSLWTKDIVLSPEAQKRIHSIVLSRRDAVANTLRKKKRNRLELADRVATEEMHLGISFLRPNMFSLLAMIYFCEGNKNDSNVGFTNSDPELMRLFIQLLRKCFSLDESKFRACLHAHDYHDIEKQKKFWSGVIDIPLQQFTRTYNKKSAHVFKKLGYQGCLRVNYYDAHVARVLLAFAKKLMKHYS